MTPQQKTIWQGIAKHAAPGQLEQADGELLRMLVVHISLAREYELKLRSSPALVRTPNGMAVQTPYLAMLNRQTGIVLKLLTSLGFTPTERARLNIGSSSIFDDSEFDEFD
ncbi:P27 family phage terminase small subunit [Sphingopyxis sp.]|uniref:P27 family phage terminase small subunit n=1 Tax=Sphingopyxis sp. TaxID=1908224 RepID=UPI001DAEC0F9|nr:P27 family phage terminase small subunit [Sphingopyxis sp.]